VRSRRSTLSLHEMKSGFYRASEYYWSQVVIGMLVFAPVTVFIGFNMMSVLAGYRAGYTYYIFGYVRCSCRFRHTSYPPK
jgi:hypothetical protein